MAKMFYSLEEAAQRLGKNPDEVRDMASSGQLQEFKDRDRVMFKREQVDLLAGDAKGGSGMIPLADSRGGSGMALGLEDSAGGSGAIDVDEPAPAASAKAKNDRSGISIFDTESTEEGDPSAVTRITPAAGGEVTLESVGSGSGLLDLTREGDDTSLGADLLEDVYKPDEGGEMGGGDTQGASGLFESTAAPSDVSAAAMAAGMPAIGMVAAEPYDAAWSGIGGGIALGTVLVLALGVAATLIGLMDAENPIASLMSSNLIMYVGIFAAVIALFGIVGWVIGRRG